MNKQIVTFSVLAIALVFAVVLGSNVASQNYETLSIYAVSAIALYFLIHGWKNVWWFTALLVFSGVVFRQGFIFDANHLFVLMVLLASGISAINRSFIPQSLYFKSAGANGAALWVGLLILYGGLHFMGNLAFPWSASEYSLKTSLKAYFECYASMFVFLWLLKGPYGFKLSDKWSKGFLMILLFAVLGNVAARGVLYLQGFKASGVEGSGDFQEYFLYVPVINMQAGVYTLRDLCPIAAVILGMVMTAPGWWRSASPAMKISMLAGLSLVLVGSIFSGGRATLPFAIGLLGIVALLRKQIGAIILSGMLLVLVVVIANLFSDYINHKAPTYIARSLQYVLIDKGSAYEGIEGSQEVRDAARDEAFIVWRSDPRITVVGRSVLAITAEEALIVGQTLGMDGFVMNAMKSGRTHMLITDLLLQYGFIGCFLYMVSYICVMIFFIKLYRRLPQELVLEKAVCGAVAIYIPFIMIYQVIGGQFMPPVVALVVGILRARLVAYEEKVLAEQEKTKDETQATPAPRFSTT